MSTYRHPHRRTFFGFLLIPLDSSVKLYQSENKMDSLQPKDQLNHQEKMTFAITLRCLLLTYMRTMPFLVLRGKNCINPSPTCFLDFPEHILLIISAQPLASRTSCLSWVWDKSLPGRHAACRQCKTDASEWYKQDVGDRFDINTRKHKVSTQKRDRHQKRKRLWNTLAKANMCKIPIKFQFHNVHLFLCIYGEDCFVT